MNLLVTNMKWVMLVSGLLTCTMFYALLAPQAALESTFGESLQGPVAEIVVRNWGALIGITGLMLIYGAFNPESRSMALTVGLAGKLIFISLILIYGSKYLGHQAGVAVVVDSIMVLLFAAYLVGARGNRVSS